MDLQKGKGRPGLPGLKLGAAPAQGQVNSLIYGFWYLINDVKVVPQKVMIILSGWTESWTHWTGHSYSRACARCSIFSSSYIHIFIPCSVRKTSIIQPRADHSQPHSLLSGGESPHSPTGS